MLFFFQSTPDFSAFDISPGAIQEFGTVRQAAEVDVLYELTNSLSVPLAILDVGTSCGCTSSQISRKDIGPGESAALTLTYKSGQSRGEVRVHAIVVYQCDNEASPRSMALRATGDIDPDYGIEPEQLNFSSTEPSSLTVALWPRHIPSLNIAKAMCDKRFFSARIIDADSSGKQLVEVSFNPEGFYADAGPAHLVIHTDSNRQPIARIPLKVAY